MATRNHWFGHKWLGAGYAPASWQGWLCFLAWIVAVGWTLKVTPGLFADHTAGYAATLAVVVAETSALFWIIWAKRDRSRTYRWRWFGGR